MTTTTKAAKVRTLIAAAVLALGLAGTARADLLVATDLNTDGTDVGFSGGWIGSVNRFVQDGPDLIYANYFIAQSGTTERVFVGNNTHPDRMRSRNLESAMSGNIWFSVLVNVPSDGGFAGLAFATDTTSQGQAAAYSHNLSDLRVVMSPDQLWIDWEGGAVNASWTPDATAGSFSPGTHLILGQMIVGAGADTLNVWVDPDLTSVTSPAGLPAATYSNTAVDFADSIQRIGVPLQVSGKDIADAIWMSNRDTAFYDVTGIPAPGPDTTYEAWADGAPFDEDTSGDGIPNGVAWVLGAPEPGSDVRALELLPTIETVDDEGEEIMVFTFQRLRAANADENTEIEVEYSADLTDAGGWTDAVHDGDDIVIDETEDGDFDIVEVRFKTSAVAAYGRLFVRLRVAQLP